MGEVHALDRRSRRTLLLSSATLRRARAAVDRWVAQGYGLTIVPDLTLLEGKPSVQTWIRAVCDTVEEMVRHGHRVHVLRGRGDAALEAVLQELARRQLPLEIESWE
jgi:hypothetical protein